MNTVIQCNRKEGARLAWQFRNDVPLYTQLIEQIEQKILTGELRPGDRLPSVRDFAMEAGVNPNTMQRALAELERLELVYVQRTVGRFVTEEEEKIKDLRGETAKTRVRAFLDGMFHLGFSLEEVLALMQAEGEKDA